MSIRIDNIKEFVLDIEQCLIGEDSEPIDCIENATEKFGTKIRTKKSKKNKEGKTKRKPSAWNLAVKDCFANGMDMKACSGWWKTLTQELKDQVVSKYT